MTRPARAASRFGAAQGVGPVYPVGGFPVFHFVYPVRPEQLWYPSEWSGNKILWVARTYRGPALVRGRQLDGPNEVRFDLERVPVKEMYLGLKTRERPSTTRVRAPGCYAWQVDGTSFSRVIVFRAEVQPD